MKLIKNNCEACDYNAPYINNLSDKVEDRLCGACLNVYEKESQDFNAPFFFDFRNASKLILKESQ